MALTVGELVAYIRVDRSGFRHGLRETRRDLALMQSNMDDTLRDVSGTFAREGEKAGRSWFSNMISWVVGRSEYRTAVRETTRQMVDETTRVVRSADRDSRTSRDTGRSGGIDDDKDRDDSRSRNRAVDSGRRLGSLFNSGFGSTLLNPLIGIPALAAAAALAIPASVAVAAATLAGAGLGAIFAGAFALRGNPLLQQAGRGFMGILSDTLSEAAQPLLWPLVQAIDIVADAIQAIGPDLRAMFAAIAPSIPVLAEGIGGFIRAFTPGMLEAVRASGPVLEQVALALPDLGNALAQFMISMAIVAPAAADFIGKLLRGLADLIRVTGDVIAFMAGGWYTFVAALRAVGQAFGYVVDGFRLAGRILTGDTAALQRVLSDFVALLVEIWRRAWDRIRRATSDARNDVVATVRGIPAAILAALGNLGGLLYDPGRNLVAGLWRGIQSMGGWLRDTLTSWATQAIPGPIRQALGISSPSRLMAERVGRWVPLGIVAGIQSQAPALRNAMAGLAGSMAPAAPAATAGSGPRVSVAVNVREGALGFLREFIDVQIRRDDAAAVLAQSGGTRF